MPNKLVSMEEIHATVHAQVLSSLRSVSDQKNCSPLPWVFKKEGGDQCRNEILDADGARVTGDEPYQEMSPMDDDMAFIVEAVNWYAEHLAKQSTSQTRSTTEQKAA